MDEFRRADSKHYFPAKNAIGYMYYFGLGVRKDKRIASDYFGTVITSHETVLEQQDNLVNMAALLLDDEQFLSHNVSLAFSYLNMMNKSDIMGGKYILGMIHDYSLYSEERSCSLVIEFFRSISEKSETSKFKFDLAHAAHREGKNRTATLLFMELAEEGHEVF